MEYTQDVQRRNFIQRYFGDDEEALEMDAEEMLFRTILNVVLLVPE